MRFLGSIAWLLARAAFASALLLTVVMLLWLATSGSEKGWVGVRLAAYDAQRAVYAQLGWPLPGTPDLARLNERLAEKGLTKGSAVFIRIFKREQELELWLKKESSFVLFASYPICRYSGRLGPKLSEGDYQAPEGFYTVGRAQLNPKSCCHKSFNLGFPNLYDAANARSGSFLMVHGSCMSSGCYAMTDAVIDEIWDLVVSAFDKGQKRFAVHIFPFRMTEPTFAILGGGQWNGFWLDLKRAYDLFEASHTPPKINLCAKRYVAEMGVPGNSGGDELVEHCVETKERHS
jgi:murein L,D-transpeptidase YafK